MKFDIEKHKQKLASILRDLDRGESYTVPATDAALDKQWQALVKDVIKPILAASGEVTGATGRPLTVSNGDGVRFEVRPTRKANPTVYEFQHANGTVSLVQQGRGTIRTWRLGEFTPNAVSVEVQAVFINRR